MKPDSSLPSPPASGRVRRACLDPRPFRTRPRLAPDFTRTRPRLASTLVPIVAGLCITLAGPVAFASRAPGISAGQIDRVEPSLTRQALDHPNDSVVAWIYFTDRAGADHDPEALAAARRAMAPRSLARRALRGSLRDLEAADLPVHEPYVRALVARGARLRGTSRWLDAASVEIPGSLVLELARLPFVLRIERVPIGRPIGEVGLPEPVPSDPSASPSAGAPGMGAARLSPLSSPVPGDTAYYGGTFRQLEMMQVPALHAQGLTGAGVLVCMLDSGFHLTHQVYASLDVVATRDFIHGDSVVDNEPGQDSTGQNTHGTWTLSCVAGSKPGTFSGVAFGAAVALGKTEWVPTETAVEMDYWQFGAEWADSLGADVISSSLGYSEFDGGVGSYTYADMDGRTTVVTRAAVEAARRGITVVTAAGNEGASPWHYIIAPGDADSVITSGAVDSTDALASFSSRGPTSDGRTKPDVTAMGRSVVCPNTNNDTAYVRVSGTSFSTPLTAGLVALLLEAHPAWGPWEVRDALRKTALNHAAPNTAIGWGLVQGLAARNWVPSATGVPPQGEALGLSLTAGPNPMRAGLGTTIRFAARGRARAEIEVIDLAGRRRVKLFAGEVEGPRSVAWDGRDDRHAPLPAGVYWVRFTVGDPPSSAPPQATRAIPVVVLP